MGWGDIHKQNYDKKILDKDKVNYYYKSRNKDIDKEQPYTYIIRFKGGE